MQVALGGLDHRFLLEVFLLPTNSDVCENHLKFPDCLKAILCAAASSVSPKRSQTYQINFQCNHTHFQKWPAEMLHVQRESPGSLRLKRWNI